MKKNQKSLVVLTLSLAWGLLGYTAWRCLPVHAAEAPGRKVAFYQDSMHPWVKADRPGKCTICGMDLTPVCEGEAGFGSDANVVVLSSNQVTVLNVQTEAAGRRVLGRKLRVAGTLEANETSKTVVSAPARGRVDALFVGYAGVEVEQGQKLITLFSPELVQLRKTLLAVRQLNPSLATNSLPGISSGTDVYSGDILAPQSGMVVERNVYNGQYVTEGDRLLTIVDSSVLWFRFDVYQEQLPWFGLGQALEVEVSGIPGKVFPAVISFVEPTFNDATRTVKVRADIRNPMVEVNGYKQRLLKYGMYAEGRVRAEVPNVLAVPRTAILFPGGGAYAYVEKGGGAYERRTLKLGRQGDEFWEVLGGIHEGDRVVTAGNVLIDAQAQFSQAGKAETTGVEEMPSAEPAGGQGAWAGVPSQVTTAPRVTETVAMAQPPPVGLNSPAMLASMGTNRMTAQAAKEHPSAARTKRMSAVMSPGAELLVLRRATITAELAQKSANAAASGSGPALPELITRADAISGALAADNLQNFNQQTTNLPALLIRAQEELKSHHDCAESLERLSKMAWTPAGDLAQARKQFLPFSTAMVDLVKAMRKEDPAFASLKIYHCPMAPKPGLWIQGKGPLANPFYGAKMLTCGEEVAD